MEIPLLRMLITCLLIGTLWGCAGESIPEDNLGGVQKLDEPIAEGEVQKFLKIVARLPEGEPPTFTPLSDSFYFDDPSSKLIQDCRVRFKKQFDIERQGKIWKLNRQIRQGAAAEGRSTSELAALMVTLSTAICRSQFDDPQDLIKLQQHGERETERIRQRVDFIDQSGAANKTAASTQERTELAMGLSRTVALVEYLKVLQKVPRENVEIVRRYRQELSSVVDKDALENLNHKALLAAFDPRNDQIHR